MDRETIDTFMTITGSSEEFALQRLEEHDGDLNQAVGAYFREGDRNLVQAAPISAVEDDLMECPPEVVTRRPSLFPGATNDLLDRSRLFDSTSDLRGRAPVVSHPREVREIPIEVKDVTDTVHGHGPEIRGTVTIVDDDTDDLSDIHSHYMGDQNLYSRPGPSAPIIDAAPYDGIDIEQEMIRAAIEASKKEAELQMHQDLSNAGNLGDDEISGAVSLPLKDELYEAALQAESKREIDVAAVEAEREREFKAAMKAIEDEDAAKEAALDEECQKQEEADRKLEEQGAGGEGSRDDEPDNKLLRNLMVLHMAANRLEKDVKFVLRTYSSLLDDNYIPGYLSAMTENLWCSSLCDFAENMIEHPEVSKFILETDVDGFFVAFEEWANGIEFYIKRGVTQQDIDTLGKVCFEPLVPVLKSVILLCSKVDTRYEIAFKDWLRSHCLLTNFFMLHFTSGFTDPKYDWLLAQPDLLGIEDQNKLMISIFPFRYTDNHFLPAIYISRENLFQDSYDKITALDKYELAENLNIKFLDELGFGTGVLCQWFLLISQDIFGANRGLFESCAENKRRVLPKACHGDTTRLDYLAFAGKVVGLSLMCRVCIGIELDRVFFRLLAGEDVLLQDIREIDTELYRSYICLREMSARDFDQSETMYFILGDAALCDGGESKAIKVENRDKFISLAINHRFQRGIKEEVEYFSEGLLDVLLKAKYLRLLFRFLSFDSLNRLLGGDKTLSTEDWKRHTDYTGDYVENDTEIIWLWEIIEELLEEEKRSLLCFWTAVRYTPPGGFGMLDKRLKVLKLLDSVDAYPTAATCFYHLNLPQFTTKAKMVQRLKDIIGNQIISDSFELQ